MRFIAIFLILACLCQNASAQTIAPGGVQDFLFWGMMHDTEYGQLFRIKTPQGESMLPIERTANTQQQLFNFNPALDMGAVKTQLDFSLAEYDLSQMSLIAVLYPADSVRERSVWFIEKDAKTSLISTTHRTADLEDEGFMNFLDHRTGLPVINTYLQFKQQDTMPHFSQKLVLGKKPVLPDLPIESFKGLLAEVIVYNRVLAADERMRIETYLAIKYGLSLSQNSAGVWLNSAGAVIFEAAQKRMFSSRTIAIGRDDNSGLYQKQSTSSYESGLPAIGVKKVMKDNPSNNAFIENNAFRFFADDNGPAVLGEQEKGKPHFIQRKWMTKSIGETDNLDFELRLDTRLTNARLREGNVWWLAIDRSGKGNFEPDHTEYFPASEFTASKTAVFSNIKWDTDRSGEDVFTFGIGAVNPADWDLEAPLVPSLTDDFLFIEMFPNPAPEGRFQVAIALKAEASASILVTDVAGKRVWSKRLAGREYYFENIHLNVRSGAYIVTIYSGNSVKSFPLIVE
jgi:hypothetical protein